MSDPDDWFSTASTDTKAKAADQLNDAVNSSDTKSGLKDAITNLSGVAIQVGQAFTDIEGRLNRVPKNNISKRLADDINDLCTRWKKHKDTYVNLVWKSRKIAGTCEFNANDFLDIVLKTTDDPNADASYKLQMCGAYESYMNKRMDESESLSQGFLDLKNDVEQFKKDWAAKITADLDAAAKDEKARQEKLQGEIKDAQTRLDDANEKIQNITNLIQQQKEMMDQYNKRRSGFTGFFNKLGDTVSGWFGGGGKPPKIDIPNIKPWLDQKTVATETIRKCKADMGNPNADKQTIAELQKALSASNQDFTSISDKLSAFGGVWAMIRTDLQQIMEGLKAAPLSYDADFPILFTARLTAVTTGYKALAACMHLYQTTVTLPDQPSDTANKPDS